MARSKYLFVASMDVDPAKEALFNEVYNTEHCPELSKVAGVGEIARYEAESFKVLIGAKPKRCPLTDVPGSTPYMKSNLPRCCPPPPGVKRWSWDGGRSKCGPTPPIADTPCCV